MNTAIISVVFTKADVRKYCEAIGERNQLYESEQYAKTKGLLTIPLPPTMPVIMYKLLTIPWAQAGVMIHRKQACTIFERMYIDEEYRGYLSLTDVVARKGYTFQTETLFIHDKYGNLCFKSTSHIVLSDNQ